MCNYCDDSGKIILIKTFTDEPPIEVVEDCPYCNGQDELFDPDDED